MKLLITHFSLASCYFFLGQNILLSVPFSDTLSPMFC